ncbi:MAG: hypothetical protein HYZ29_12120 [Myxococcales bacterium]|nr:hypothetical protein [Myxococcales bacterium]
MNTLTRLAIVPAFLLLASCAVATEGPAPSEGATDQEHDLDAPSTATTPVVSDDDLNGLWRTTVAGQLAWEPTVLESWPAVGIRWTNGAAVSALTRSADQLTAAPATSFDILAGSWSVYDDKLTGTVDGKTVTLTRDTRNKSTLTLTLPGDRTYRSWLVQDLAPAAQRDRESFTTVSAYKVKGFLTSTELYKSGSLQWKYMKGDTWSERSQNLLSIADAIDGIKITPRRLTKEKKFTDAIKANLKDESLMGLATSTLSMYFSTGAGRAVRIPIGDDSMIYFITDRPSRAERIGLVAMKTPTHGPLASTFGRQLLDLGAMAPTDDTVYTRTMMEMLVKTDGARAKQLSGVARSALTDWFAVMAIEDYRGVAFGWPTLSWGYNMTNVQLYGLVVRALARPGAVDATGKPVIGQVLVGSQLRPGDPSYADVLNNGNDMQEYADMATLKKLATAYLREKRPAQVAAVESAFANVIPKSELPYKATQDIFHFITTQLYDAKGRTANLTGASATAAIDAVTVLLDTLRQDSLAFESYVVSKGYAKSNEPAPKSTGY